MTGIKRALISVTNKAGLVEFAGGLAGLGVELVSTGGTAKLLRESSLAVKDVSELTGFPEMLDGRVKTIHPRIAGGILAMRGKPDHMAAVARHDIPLVDMVVVNLYEFEAVAARAGVTHEQLIENIDIGGPTMIRAAAKNYQDVAVVVSPRDYQEVLEEMRRDGGLSLQTRWSLAQRAFALTAAYDRAISARIARIEVAGDTYQDKAADLPEVLDILKPKAFGLRHGENPHQLAALYATGNEGVAGAVQLQGKELSYNNLVDLDAAWQLVLEFDGPCAAIIKHTNPCGCASQSTLAESYRKAYEADPVSAFGGVLAFNRQLDEETASEVAKTFIEAIAAPGYTPEALALLASKKNLRLVDVQRQAAETHVVKSITGGFLVQTADTGRLQRSRMEVKTQRQPTEEEWAAMAFAWKVVKHVKSNAIVYGRAGQSISVGAGQMSRVDSVKVGAMKAVLPLAGTVLASDAFFPFPDGVEEAAKHGITAVIQPGGSVRDADVIAAADRLGLAMVFTGIRHFRH